MSEETPSSIEGSEQGKKTDEVTLTPRRGRQSERNVFEARQRGRGRN